MKIDKRADSQLVEAFQTGNKEALAILVKRWHLTFCKKAFWIVKDADISKDIAQESWAVIIYKINSLKDTNSFGSWALRIVYSKSLDALRKNSKEKLRQQEYAKNNVETIVDDKDDNTSLKRNLLFAIQDLPKQQQMVIKLFYLEEYSLKEISKTLNISEGTTKSRLFYAREKLKSIIKKQKS